MQQARDEAGNIWDVSDPNNPVLVQAAGQPPADPSFPYQGAQAEADVEATRARTQASRASAYASVASAENARINARIGQIEASQAAQEASDWRKANAAKAIREAAEFDDIMDRINQARDIITQNGGVGWAGLLAGIPSSQATNLTAVLAPLRAENAFDRLQQMRDESKTGGALGQVSERELDLLMNALGGISDLTVSKDIFLKELDRVQDRLIGVYAGAGLSFDDLERDDIGAAYRRRFEEVKREYRPNLTRDDDDGAPALGQSTSETYATPEDLELQRKVQSAFNRGATVDELIDIQESFGRPVDEGRRGLLEANVKARDAGMTTRAIPVPESGVQSNFRQGVNSLIQNMPGTAGYFTGAGNAITFGGLDEIVGATTGVGTNYADTAKGLIRDAAGGAYLGGELTGGLIQGATGAGVAPNLARMLTSTAPRALATGATYGAVSGIGEMNDSRFIGGALGATAGGVGGYAGQKIGNRLATALTRPSNAETGAIVGALREGNVEPQRMGRIAEMIREAQRLNVPLSLADTDPNLRALAGSVTRLSPEGREIAENITDLRGANRFDRFSSAVDDLAPGSLGFDPKAARAERLKAGSDAAGPLYRDAYAQNPMDDPEITSILRTPEGQDALRKAYRQIQNEQRDPTALGFRIDESGNVSLNDLSQSGRYVAPRGANERGMEKAIDLVGFVRQQGGLNSRSARGDLEAIGFNNAQRRGDFTGNETRLGPLVSDNGQDLDRAAEAAFEAGYFPELDAPPDNRTFLNALRDTWEGVNRRFTPEGQRLFDDFNAARSDRLSAAESRSMGQVTDNSVPAGPERPFAPRVEEVSLPTVESLHYVKRALDDIAETARDPQRGTLDFSGKPEARAANQLRARLNDRLGQLSPDYARANEVYSNFAQQAGAIDLGRNATRNQMTLADFNSRIAAMREADADFKSADQMRLPYAQRGYGAEMINQAENARLNGVANPYDSQFGSTKQRQKIGELFPDTAQDFATRAGLERQIARTGQELVGGSPTATRVASDAAFVNQLPFSATTAADFAGGGGMFTAARAAGGLGNRILQATGDALTQRRAARIADPLINPDFLRSQQATAEAMELARREAARRSLFGLGGAAGGMALVPAASASYFSN